MPLHSIFTASLSAAVVLAGLMLPQAALAQATPSASAAGDDTLLAMSQAYKAGERKRLSALLPQARGHLLEPWAAYWELALRLDDASNAEVQDFLSHYAGSYQEDRLRNDWLLLLGKRRDWATFNAEYPKYRMNDDRAVRCYALLADASANGSRGADGAAQAAQVQDNWLAQKEADEGCAAAAEQLLQTGKLAPLVAWQRARLGLESDKLRIVTQALGLLNAEGAERFKTLYAKPARALDDRALQAPELLTLALIRLAMLDYDAAATELSKARWQSQLSDEQRSWLWAVIGKRAAFRLAPEAAGYFAQTQDSYLPPDLLAWKVRAALRSGAWAQVLGSIAAMSPAQAQDPSWIYWRARALQALKGPQSETQAQALYLSIASGKGFYEQLALDELGLKVMVPAQPVPPTAAEKASALNDAGLRRALYAIALGLRTEGVREWNYSVNLHQRGGMTDRELLAAAQLACDAQVWDRCINTSERTKGVVDFDQRYPMPYRAEVTQRSSTIGLDPAYVYGLIRQESRFIMDAKSNVGASGLMQVMPATAKWTARKIGLSGFKPHHITERDTNIAIGTGYLKLVLDSFDGSLPLAAAAYNAGPSRSRSWRNAAGSAGLEAAIWTENVPFSETRDYVKKVLANTTNYAVLISGKPQSLKARLGSIGPGKGGAAETGEELP